MHAHSEVLQRYETLTPKQREVCALMVTGMLSKNIAAQLGSSINTIKTHRNEIFRKMGASSLLELARQVDLLKQAATMPSATNTSTPGLEALNVLLVENNPELRQATLMGLASLGHCARGLSHGDTVIEELRATNTDIVLLDIGLGANRLDGFQLAQMIRSQLPVGIVMFTARGERDARIRGFHEGADAYLVKPVDLHELDAVMLSVARRLYPGRNEP